MDDRLKWNVRMVSAYHSGFAQVIIGPSGSMSIFCCIFVILAMSKDLVILCEIWGVLSSTSYKLVITIFFHILLTWQELINDKLLISMWWESQKMDVTNAMNVDSRWHIMEGQTLKSCKIMGRGKWWKQWHNLYRIWYYYDENWNTPPSHRCVCAHTLRDFKRLLYSYFKMLSDP